MLAIVVIFLTVFSLICLYLDYRWNWDEELEDLRGCTTTKNGSVSSSEQ